MADPLAVAEYIIKQLGISNHKRYPIETDRSQIMKIAEKRSNYYLNGESKDYGKY